MKEARSPLQIPPSLWRALKPIGAFSSEIDLPVFLVGGCVRDIILGASTPRDIDLVCDGDPGPLAEACAAALKSRAEKFSPFGTWRVVSPRLRVDFATSRSETYPTPACLPQVSPAPLERDLGRRDFTVNAMAARLGLRPSAEVIDPFGGREDLKARVLRVLHPESFRDDPTRVFRLARYAARMRMRPAPGLIAAAREALDLGHAARLSPHRVAMELWRILGEPEPGRALALLRAWGYGGNLAPGFSWPKRWGAGEAVRLAQIALEMEAEGAAFIKSFPFERAVAASALDAVDVAGRRASPRGELPPAAREALRLALPRLPACALEPLLIDGRDIQRLGIPPGKRYSELLEEASRLQWKGKLRSRRAALAWLKARAR